MQERQSEKRGVGKAGMQKRQGEEAKVRKGGVQGKAGERRCKGTDRKPPVQIPFQHHLGCFLVLRLMEPLQDDMRHAKTLLWGPCPQIWAQTGHLGALQLPTGLAMGQLFLQEGLGL